MSLRSDECPNCKVSLNGALIWDHFYEVTGDEKEADRISSMYGATRTNGRCFRREIGIYDMDKDITVSFRCPDCLHEWKR
jgi:hypothetical protein